MSCVAIILARGGSKGIPGKNIREIAGRPLLAWSIKQAQEASGIDSVWVSSDCPEILATSQAFGARILKRPPEISGDTASSESAWLHAISAIEHALAGHIDLIVGMQPTSPIRSSADLDEALIKYQSNNYDSLMSVTAVQDHFTWKLNSDGEAYSVNYDYQNRKRRQDLEDTYLENGSFYIFSKNGIKESENRLHGKIGMFLMEKHKMFQVDDNEDLLICEAILRGFDYC